MKSRNIKVIRSFLAVITFTFIFVALFGVVNADDNGGELNYLSLGDSMNNGYGLDDYDNAHDIGYTSGYKDYGREAYPNLFAEYLANLTEEEQLEVVGKTYDSVNHAQLAMSGLRTEDINYLLHFDYNDPEQVEFVKHADGRKWTEIVDEWNALFEYGDFWTIDQFVHDYRFDAYYRGASEEEVEFLIGKTAANYQSLADVQANVTPAFAYEAQEAVKNADVITLGTGNSNYGVFSFALILNCIGFMGTPESNNWIDFERALDSIKDEYDFLRTAILQIQAMIKEEIDALGSTGVDLSAIYDALSYALVSYLVNYIQLVDQIVYLKSQNPDPDKQKVDLILVGLMNTFSGVELDLGGGQTIDLGEVMQNACSFTSSYISSHVLLQQLLNNPNYENANIYIAEPENIESIFVTYKDTIYGDNVIRDRFVTDIVGDNGDGMIWSLLAPMFNNMIGGFISNAGLDASQFNLKLVPITRTDVELYEEFLETKDLSSEKYASLDGNKMLSCSIYLSLEKAIIESSKEAKISLEAFLGIGDLGGIFGGVGPALVNGLNFTEIMSEATSQITALGEQEVIAFAAEKARTYAETNVTIWAVTSEGQAAIQNAMSRYKYFLPSTLTHSDWSMIAYGISKGIALNISINDSLGEFNSKLNNLFMTEYVTAQGTLYANKVVTEWAETSEGRIAIGEAINQYGSLLPADTTMTEWAQFVYGLEHGIVIDFTASSPVDKFISEVTSLLMGKFAESLGLPANASATEIGNQYFMIEFAKSIGTTDLVSYFTAKYGSRVTAAVIAPKITPVLTEALVTDENLIGILHIYGRCKLGNSLSTHPSLKGHQTLCDTVVETYVNKKDAEAHANANAEEVLQAMADYIVEKYKLDIAYENIEKTYYFIQALINRLNSTETIEHFSGTEDTKYLALGDSLVTGKAVKNPATQSYPALLASALGVNNSEQYANLGIDGIRANELHYILNPEAVVDTYYTDKISEYVENAGGLEALREKVIPAVEEADIITLQVGANNYSNFAVDQVMAYIQGNEMYEMDWDKHLNFDLSGKVLEYKTKYYDEIYGYLESEAGLVIDDTSKEMIEKLLDIFIYSSINYVYHMEATMAKIREYNEDVFIIVLGTYNPLKGVYYEVEGTERMELGEMLDEVIALIDDYLVQLANDYDNCVYVDISETTLLVDQYSIISKNFAETTKVAGYDVPLPKFLSYTMTNSFRMLH
ncbi:MAG: hypothetical protein IJX78_00815, partial [Bacilli bacterium]|nr:hypothetical protein [Bacilli bacterium]